MQAVFILLSWSDTFPGITIGSTYNGNELNPMKSQINDKTSGGIWVKNCVFLSLDSSSFGGAIKSTSSKALLVESSLFNKVTTSTATGGAVYYLYTTGGQCIFKRVCSYKCKCTFSGTSTGQFCTSSVKNIDECKNNFEDSSAVYSDPTGTDPEYIVNLNNGDITIYKGNISNNICLYNTAFYIRPSNSQVSEETPTGHTLLSSFTNNTSKEDKCLYFYGGNVFEMKKCNVISNKVSEYVFHVDGTINIIGSCIINNGNIRTFYANNYYRVRISKTTIDNIGCNYNIDYSPNKKPSFIVGLRLLETEGCEAQYDVYDPIKPSYPEGEEPTPVMVKTKHGNVNGRAIFLKINLVVLLITPFISITYI